MANFSYDNPPDDDEATLDGASEHDTDDSGAPKPTTAPDPPEHAGIKAAKAFGIGLACIVLEGVGSGLAAGPAAVYNAANSAGQAAQETTEAPKPKPNPKPKPKHKSKSKESKSKSQ